MRMEEDGITENNVHYAPYLINCFRKSDAIKAMAFAVSCLCFYKDLFIDLLCAMLNVKGIILSIRIVKL